MAKVYLMAPKALLLIAVIMLNTLLTCVTTLYAAPLPEKQNVSTADSLSRLVTTPVSFKSGLYTLKGQLLSPVQPTAKLPVIIFCVGSGGNSYTSNYTKFLSTLLEQNLPVDSVALFYFDKRGVGGSEGKWYNSSFEERAADVKAAADYLGTLPFIDKDRIAVVGHSQGGWITQICLSKYPDTFAGGISMAGPTFSVKEQVQNELASSLICKELLTTEAAWQKASKKTNFIFAAASLLPVKENWKQLKTIKDFEPSSYLTNTSKPLLLLFGENDPLVSPIYSMTKLNSLFPLGLPANIQAVTIKGANHSFKLSEICHSGSTKSLPYSEECKQQIKTWTKSFLLN